MLQVPVKGVACVIGGFILCLSFASDFSYPNLNTYLTSFMRSTGYNPNLTYGDFIFVSGTKNLLQGAAMPFLGDLSRRIGTKWSIALGSIIYSFGFGMTYFTVKYWFPLAILSISMHGIGFSLAYATAIRSAQQWFCPQRKGLVGSIVIAGYGFGSMIWVPLQTEFVNPDNIEAVVDPNCVHAGTDNEELCDFYFVDKNLLNRVPLMFALLGGVYLIMGIIAWFLITDSDIASYEENPEEFNSEVSVSTEAFENECSLKPTQVLKTPLFYQMWFGFFSIILTNGLLSNYSKTFGLTFINDDHFYANLAIILNILNGACRIFWGLIYDRIGFKWCFCSIAVVVTLATSTLPVLPYISSNSLTLKLSYGLWMSVLYATFPGIYTIMAGGVSDAFGPGHYQANFGLLWTITVFYFAIIVPMTQVDALSSVLGYIGMFAVGGVFGVVGLLACIFMPKDLRKERDKQIRENKTRTVE